MKMTKFYTKAALAALTMGIPLTASAQLAQPDTLYYQPFDEASSFLTMTNVDADRNGHQWEFDQYSYKKGYARVLHNYDSDSNNWLLTPEISLEGGRIYVLDYKAYGNGYFSDEQVSQYMNVAFGQGADYTQYATVSPDKEVKPARDFRNYRIYLKVKDAGHYRAAFNDVSTAQSYVLFLDDICLTKGCLLQAPDSVQAFTATAAANGVAQAHISLTAPVQTADGQSLSSLDKVLVYRDGKLVKVFTAPAPGAQLSFDDAQAPDGYVTYQVVAANASGDGIVTSRTVYVGVDIPGAPSNVSSTDMGDKLHLEWQAPTAGQRGFYIDPAKLTYNVYSVSGYQVEQVARNISGTSIDFDNNFSGAQHSANFRITAQSTAGEGKSADAPELILGTNYTLPFAETFTGGKTQQYWWKEASSYYNFSLVSKDVKPGVPNEGYDDNSYAEFYPMEMDEDNCWASLNTGKISLRGTTKPTLKLGYRFDVRGELMFKVLVKVPGKDDEMVFGDQRVNAATGWHSAKVDLSKYINEPYVILKFWAKGGDGYYIDFDNVTITDGDFDTDLATELTMPEQATAGEPVSVNVRVANYGTTTVDNYQVQVLMDGKPVNDATMYVEEQPVSGNTVNKALGSMQAEPLVFTFQLPTDLNEVTLAARVTASGDENESNDECRAQTLPLEPTQLTPATALVAKKDGTQVNLTWTAPDVKNNAVTDDFESYPAFDISAANISYYNMGPWRMFDGDQSYTQGIPYSETDDSGVSTSYVVAYPGNVQEDAFAWMVFAPEQTTPKVETLYSAGQFTPHSGKQYLVAATATDPATSATTSDDWLISPLLSGDAQKLQFYAMSPSSWGENFEVYTSSHTNNTEDFTLLKSDITGSNRDDWKLFEYDLPAGTKYFAIRYCSDSKFMMLLDDISYSTGDGTLTGYNVYRDGERVATVAADASSYLDSEAGTADHAYTVTAVYTRGESSHSNVAGTSAGISSLTGGTAGVTSVYDLNGRRLPSAAHQGIYVVRRANGQATKVVKR